MVMGAPYSGLRCVIFSSLVLMVVAFILSCTMKELTDVEAERTAKSLVMTPPPLRSTPEMRKLMNGNGTVSPGSATAIALAQSRRGLRRSSSTIAISSRRLDSPRWMSRLGDETEAAQDGSVGAAEPGNMCNPNFWRVVVFVTAILFTSQQVR